MKIITQGETPTFQWFIGARTDEVEEVRVVITDKKTTVVVDDEDILRKPIKDGKAFVASIALSHADSLSFDAPCDLIVECSIVTNEEKYYTIDKETVHLKKNYYNEEEEE